ncbi:uncharacterized protein LOC144037189 isoform X2 [Vanacampus margaritifer]
MCESLNYVQVTLALSAYETLPPLLGDGKLNAAMSKEDGGETKNICPALSASEKSYKICCQNCNIQLGTPQQYFQHVQNEQHKMMMKTIFSHDNANPPDTGQMQDRDHNAAAAERFNLEHDIFNQLDEFSAPGASMMIFCHNSQAASEAVCVCCACQDAIPKTSLKEHLNTHRHLLQTLLYLNPWRLPFGWKQVPGLTLLQAEVDAEEKERWWSRVVIKVMDLPSSMLNSISPPSYQKVPPCRTFSRFHEHNSYPLLGRNFVALHDAHDAANNATFESLLCLLCERRLSNEEGYAHAFSWQHVTRFLERFHPGSLTADCGTKVLLDLASQAARIHSVSCIQKIKLDKPVEEPCSYTKVKLILSTAKRRFSKCSLIPIVLPQAQLVPKGTVSSPTQERSGYSWTERGRKRLRDALDEEMSMKRSATEMAPQEEKPKIKRENIEQTIESPSKLKNLCTTSADVSPTVASGQLTAPTTSCATKLRAVTTTTPCSVTATKFTSPSARSYLAKRLTAPSVCETKSGDVSTMSSTTRKSTAPASSCAKTPSGVAASSAKATTVTVSHGATLSTLTAPSAAVHHATIFCATPATAALVNGANGPSAKISFHAPQAASKPTGAVHGATVTKPAAPNTAHGATPSAMAAGSTAPVASCAVSTSKFIASDSSPKPSFAKPPLGPKVPEVGAEREAASKTLLQSRGGAPETTTTAAALRCRKSEDKKVSNLADAEPRASKSHPCAARLATSAAKPSHSKAKATVLKVGLSFIVAVNSDGRKQSYCTLCHIRLESSSHLTEDVHLYNYLKRRFPELSDVGLLGINQDKLISSMAEVEKCLGLRNIQEIDVTTEEYNDLSNLTVAQALQRLETRFLASSNAPVHFPRTSLVSWQGSSSPEDGFDTESRSSPAADQTTEPAEASGHSSHGYKCGKDISDKRDFDALKLADENPQSVEPAMSISPDEAQTGDPALKDAGESSPSVLVGPDPKICDPGLKAMEENLSAFSEPSPPVPLDPEPQRVEKTSPPDRHALSPLRRGLPPPASVNVEPQSLLVKRKIERRSSPNKGICRVPIVSGNASNLSTFLWVRGLSDQPVIGLASVYECRGISKNSFYFCESCGKKFSVGDICQHMPSVDHQLAYMLKAFPHFMDSFWYDEDVLDEMKWDILNDFVIKVAAQEHSRKMDAKVLFLSQELYENVWNAPFKEALAMLRSATRQPVDAAQQSAKQTSEKLSGQDKDLCENADCVPSASPASTSVRLQENRTSALIKAEPPVPSPVSRTPPVLQLKDRVMRRPHKNLDSVTKSPSPSFHAKAQLKPPEFESLKPAGSVSESQPRFQVKADLRPLESGSDAKAGPISQEQPSFHVTAKQMPQESGSFGTFDPIAEEQPNSQVMAELVSQVYGIAETVRPILGDQLSSPPTTLSALEVPQDCQAKEELDPSSETAPVSRVRDETLRLDNRSPESSGCVSKTQPSSQMKAELTHLKRRPPVAAFPASKMPSCFQVKEQTRSRGAAPSTTSPIIRQDESLPTRKRASHDSLDKLIRSFANKPQVCDARPSKCRRKSLKAKLATSTNVNPPTILVEAGQGGCGCGNRNSGSDRCSPEAVDSVAAAVVGHSPSKARHMTPVQQHITGTVKSNSREDLKSCQIGPSTTPGMRRVTPDRVSSSSPHKSVVVMEKATTTDVPRHPDWSEAADVKPAADTICPSASHDNVAAPGYANTHTMPMQIPVITKGVKSTCDALTAAAAGPSQAQPSNTGSSGQQITCISNRYSRYAPFSPAAGNWRPSSLPPANENAGQAYPVQFYLPQAANQGPMGGYYPTSAGWLNLHTQQWPAVQQQQYRATLLQTTANVTNDATVFVPISAACNGAAVALLPVNGQGNVSSSHAGAHLTKGRNDS